MACSTDALYLRAPFDHLAHDAREDLRNYVTVEEVDRFAETDLTDLEITIEAIQTKQRAAGDMRNMRRLGRFLEVLESYDTFVATHVSNSDVIAFVWVNPYVSGRTRMCSAKWFTSQGPMKALLEVCLDHDSPCIGDSNIVLLEAASAVGTAFDALLDLYEQVATTLPHIDEMEPLFEADPATVTVLAMFLQDIFVFQGRAMKHFQGSGKSALSLT